MGVCLISSLTDADVASGVEKCRAYDARSWWKDIDRAPNPPMPTQRVPKYADPGKPRDMTQIVDSLTAWIARQNKGEIHATKCEAMRGRRIVGDYIVKATDARMALAELGEPYGEYKDRPSMMGQHAIEPICQVGPEAWRAYAPVRLFANERSGAVKWTVGDGRLTFACSHPELGDAKGWAPIADASARAVVTLDDDYTWPLRGATWGAGDVADCAIFMEGTQAVVAMGMRM